MTGPQGPYSQLVPGLYEDAEGNAVFNVAEILRELGMEDTPANRLQIGQALQDMVRQVHPKAEVRFTLPGNPEWRRRG